MKVAVCKWADYFFPANNRVIRISRGSRQVEAKQYEFSASESLQLQAGCTEGGIQIIFSSFHLFFPQKTPFPFQLQ